ncbi:MAG: hypothetical protein AB7K37_10440 [Cyclobacteriaceae bacterium]
MSHFEKLRLDAELKEFTHRNFEKPTHCRNLEQVRFYVRELCVKIEDYERRFNYVPSWAYALLAQYNLAQNRMIYAEFKKAYS